MGQIPRFTRSPAWAKLELWAQSGLSVVRNLNVWSLVFHRKLQIPPEAQSPLSLAFWGCPNPA